MAAHIDHLFFINLDYRVDRRIEIEEELDVIGIEGERFPGIYYEPPLGYLGCTKSHYEVIKLAKERGYKNVIVLEDDFKFKVSSDEFHQIMNDFFALNMDYNVVALAFNEIVPANPINEIVSEVLNIQTTAGYMVSSQFYDEMLANYAYAIQKCEQTKLSHYTIDVTWKLLQGPGKKFFRFNTRIGVQRAGISDCGDGNYNDPQDAY